MFSVSILGWTKASFIEMGHNEIISNFFMAVCVLSALIHLYYNICDDDDDEMIEFCIDVHNNI